MRSNYPWYAAALGLLTIAALALADRIEVEPGPDAIASAIRRANADDVIALAPGRYEESIELPDGVVLEGAGPDATTIVGSAFAAITVRGNEVIIRGIEIRGGEETRRGVNASTSIRVERCRFVEIPEAVALFGAPLSDVLDCEFVDCDLGVRAIGGASPTIWGCWFRGGRIGVFSLHGGPYMCSNVFSGVSRGVLVATKELSRVSIRNNVFVDCSESAIEAEGEMPLPFAHVVNCVFARCGAVMVSTAEHMGRLRHCAIDACGEDPFRETDEARFDAEAASLLHASLNVQIDDSGGVTIGNSAPLEGNAEPRPHAGEEEETVIGLLKQSGVDQPVRFRAQPFVANDTGEQYLYMQLHGMRPRMQSLFIRDGRPVDSQRVVVNGEERELLFDVSRYHGQF